MQDVQPIAQQIRLGIEFAPCIAIASLDAFANGFGLPRQRARAGTDDRSRVDVAETFRQVPDGGVIFCLDDAIHEFLSQGQEHHSARSCACG